MKLREKTKAVELLERYCEAYKQRNLELISSLFTKDCHIWGTAIDEKRIGIKELEIQHHRDWSQSEKGEIHIMKWVSTPRDALFAAAECRAVITIEGKENILDDLRGTIIIREEEGIWKILHMHASFPDFRNVPNSSFPSEG